MRRRYRKTAYLAHVCTAATCRAYATTEGMAEYDSARSYHDAFEGIIKWEGIDYSRMQSGERVHVIHIDKTDAWRTTGERYYWRKP